MAAEKVSGAAVFVMMAESFVPRGADLEEKRKINIDIRPQLFSVFNQNLTALIDPFFRPKVLVWNGEDGSHGQR